MDTSPARANLGRVAIGVSRFTVFDYHDTWPLLAVAAGALVVWDGVAAGGAARSATEDGHGR